MKLVDIDVIYFSATARVCDFAEYLDKKSQPLWNISVSFKYVRGYI
jgi:hypothetical protein